MKDLPTEKDVPAVDNDPVRDAQREKNVHNPMGVNSFEGLG